MMGFWNRAWWVASVKLVEKVAVNSHLRLLPILYVSLAEAGDR